MVLENELEMEWMANTPHLLEVEEEEEVGRPAHPPAEGYIVHFSIIWTLLYDYYLLLLFEGCSVSLRIGEIYSHPRRNQIDNIDPMTNEWGRAQPNERTLTGGREWEYIHIVHVLWCRQFIDPHIL